jgi:hypothetical protein
MIVYDRNGTEEKNRPNYYVVLRYQDNKTGKERQKWVTTDISVKGSNKKWLKKGVLKYWLNMKINKLKLTTTFFR